MKHQVPHDLGMDKAKKATLAAFESYRQRFAKYDPRANWVGDDRANISFSVKGITLSGTLEVKPDSIDMDLDVPFLLRPFKKQAIGVIEGEIKRWVDRARAGEV